jgi:hypothetical protein
MQPLEIIVTGNVDGAKSSLQSIQAELGKTALAAQKGDSAIDTFGKTMARFGAQGGQSIALLTGKIEALKAEMVNIKDISVLAKFNQEIEASELQLGKMSNAGKTGFNELGMAIEKTGNPLSHGYGILRKIAYVLPGIGISGLVAFATEPIINFVEKLIDANRGIDEVQNNLNNLNDVMADANKKAGEQISTLKLLYQAATDVNLSMKDRLAAAKELQKEFPEYFGNIKTETILNGNAKKSYDELTTSIIANSRAKAAKDKIDELESQRLDAEFQKQKIINATTNEANAAKTRTLQSQTTGSSLTGGGASTGAVTITRAEQIKAINERRDAALKIQDINIKSLQDQEDFLTKFAGLPTIAQVIEDGDKKKTKAGKKTNPFEISLKDLEDNYKKAQALLVSQYDADTNNAKKNTTAINDLLLRAQQDFLEKKLALIKQYGKKEGDTDLEIAKVNKALIANQIAFNIDQINTLPKVQGAPVINFKKATTEKIDPKPYYELSDAIKANIKLQAQQLELFNETSLVLNKTLGPAFDALFTNILDGSGNAFQAFGEAIKQMMVQLAAAVLKAAAFAAILSLLPGSAEFGTIFKKTLGFSKGGEVKGFATGGFINGPGTTSSDSILARLSRGEYIINAATVSKFGTSFFDNLNSGMLPKFNRGGSFGSNQLVTSTTAIDHYFHGEIAGDKLLLLHDRATARRRRNS